MTTYYSRHNMPGVPRQTGYTGSYGTSSTRVSTRQRASSLSRENSATRSYTPSSKPPRPLPHGPGPLDTYGRKIDGTNYKIKTTSTSGLHSNGPLKATNNYASTYTSSYSSSYGTGTGSGTSSRPSSGLKNRRSTSISNISDTLSDVRLTDSDSRRIRNREESNGLSSYRSSHDEYTPRGSKAKLDNDDIFNSSRTSSRNSRLLKDNNSFDESYTPSISRKRDASLPPMSRKDSSPLDSRPSLTGQNSISPINANGSLSQHVNGGKVGLRNLGNTCFMNSVLQCLSNTKPLLEYFLRDDFTFDKNTTISSMKGQLVTAYANLMKSMWNEKSDSQVSPNSFKTQIQRFAPRFMGYAQQDAQEFLRYLLEGLHEDVNKVTSKPKPVTIQDEDFSNDQDKAKEYWRVYLTYDNSHIVEIFVGQLKSELRFDCDHRSVTFDPFWDLSVPIPKMRNDVSIIQCLTAFMKAEVLDGDERPTCSKCKKRMRCTKSFSIQRFPTILVLHLKRFSQGRYSQKVSTCVDFPQVLDMTEYSSEKGGKRVLYNLYGVSNHSGGVHSGHYTANCKHPYNGEWNVFNDTRVSPTSASRAVSSEAYLLFYERVNDPSRL